MSKADIIEKYEKEILNRKLLILWWKFKNTFRKGSPIFIGSLPEDKNKYKNFILASQEFKGLKLKWKKFEISYEPYVKGHFYFSKNEFLFFIINIYGLIFRIWRNKGTDKLSFVRR